MPFCSLEIRAKRPNYQDNWIRDQAVSANPKTLGEHIRKVRLERRLFQRDLAKLCGVEKTSVQNWERGVGIPNIRVIPKIIDFLAYYPESVPSTLALRIAYARRRLGCTQEELANMLGVTSFKLWEWESGRLIPEPKPLRTLKGLLKDAGIALQSF